jgi:hypothetical protein
MLFVSFVALDVPLYFQHRKTLKTLMIFVSFVALDVLFIQREWPRMSHEFIINII